MSRPPYRREGQPGFQSDQKTARGSVATNPINLLIQIVSELKLNEHPVLARIVQKIAVKGDQVAAGKLVKQLSTAYYSQKITPNRFISMEPDLAGDIVIGHTEGGKAVGLNRDQLVRHIFVSGQSGSGKSTLLKSIVLQAKALDVPTIYFDRKGDMEHAINEGIDSIRWQHIRVNPLLPPHSDVPLPEYRNEFVKCFSELMQFQQRGTSIFLLGVDQLFRDFNLYERWHVWDWDQMEAPTLHDLLLVFKRSDFANKVKGQGRESLLSIIDKLESLIIELNPVITCERGFDITKLIREKRAVSYMINGISVEYQNFFIVMEMVRYSHFFGTFGPRNQGANALFVFDEAKGIFGKTNQDRFIVKNLVATVREFGIGIVAADQVPSEISQFLFSNIGTLIIFRHSDGTDLQRLRMSAGATIEQILENYTLQPGEAIIRSDRFKDLHRVKIPFNPVEKFITRDEVDRLMVPRLDELNRDVIVPRRDAEAPKKENEAKQNSHEGISDDEKRFLDSLANDFCRPSSDVYQSLEFTQSKGYRLKELLRKKQFITEVATNLGRDGKKAVYLIPNPIVFEKAGINLGSGRGKALHKHFQAEMKIEAEKLGFKATLEQCLTETPEGPDVGLEKDGKKTAVEICITSKPSQECANIEKNLRLGFDNVILTFVNKQVMERTRGFAIRKYPEATLQVVKFGLVNQFAELLRGL